MDVVLFFQRPWITYTFQPAPITSTAGPSIKAVCTAPSIIMHHFPVDPVIAGQVATTKIRRISWCSWSLILLRSVVFWSVVFWSVVFSVGRFFSWSFFHVSHFLKPGRAHRHAKLAHIVHLVVLNLRNLTDQALLFFNCQRGTGTVDRGDRKQWPNLKSVSRKWD